MTKSELQDILNAVYAGAVRECEGREHEGKLVGNGHHMAQKIVENVKDEFKRRKMIPENIADCPTCGGHGGTMSPGGRSLCDDCDGEGFTKPTRTRKAAGEPIYKIGDRLIANHGYDSNDIAFVVGSVSANHGSTGAHRYWGKADNGSGPMGAYEDQCRPADGTPR